MADALQFTPSAVSQPAAGLLEQRDAGLALEHGELLRHRRGRELERVRHRRDGAALVQLAEQAKAAKVEHDEAMLPARHERIGIAPCRSIASP